MTQLLEKALREVAKLPPSEQDAVASILREQLASEQKWSELFADSQDLLAQLAGEALAEDSIREDEASVSPVLSRTNEKFRSQLAALPKPVQDKAASAYALWSANPSHPSLRFKKVQRRNTRACCTSAATSGSRTCCSTGFVAGG